MSLRLWRLALLAPAASLFSYAGPASAQIPIFRAPSDAAVAEPVAPVDSPAPTPPAASPEVTPSLDPLPSAPSPATGVGAPPPAGAAPVPAKTEVITDPSARRAAEARAARDTDDADDAAADAAERSRWYGWETLVFDGASIACVLAAASLNSQSSTSGDIGDTLAWTGLIGYEFAPGIVHFTHYNPGRGFASFGLRLGMPLAGAFLGASVASGCNRNLCEASGAGIGALLGVGGAIAIDAAVFAYDDPKRSSRNLRVLPVVSVTPQQAWFGLAGRL